MKDPDLVVLISYLWQWVRFIFDMQAVKCHNWWHKRDRVIEHPIWADHKKTDIPFCISNRRRSWAKESPHDGILSWKHLHVNFVPVKQKRFSLCHCLAGWCVTLLAWGVAMKFAEWLYCSPWREPCDLFVVETCLCMFKLAHLLFQASNDSCFFLSSQKWLICF